MSRYALEENGSFTIADYNNAPAFASFLPGIAGRFGIPMWSFYVNRGQGITSFGVEGKSGALMEFYPANQAYANTFERGFRTFVKTDKACYEPFGLDNASKDQVMTVRPESFSIAETNKKIGLSFDVTYVTLPEEDIPGLIRKVTIKNISKGSVSFELADGMPQLVPFGMNNWLLKEMSRTIEAWMDASTEGDVASYRLRVSPADVAETTFIDGSHFFMSVLGGTKKQTLLKPIVDGTLLFKEDTGYGVPHNFYDKKFDAKAAQVKTGRTPSAFAYHKATLKAGASVTFYSVFGASANDKQLKAFAKKVDEKYLSEKIERNTELVESVTDKFFCCSSSPLFDKYTKQNYLDNVLRGGSPELFGDDVYYAYTRKHGDVERDYNQFNLAPTYLSSGNGNFRDVNQNRRLDVMVEPRVGRQSINTFYSLIRADGYNPLVVKQNRFKLKDGVTPAKAVSAVVGKEVLAGIAGMIGGEFDVGEAVIKAKTLGLAKSKLNGLVEALLKNSVAMENCDFGEGFWCDHWTYNLDLVESYLAVFPDKASDLFFEKTYTFYDEAHKVNPRSTRYYLKNGKVYQGHFITKDKAKDMAIAAREGMKARVRYKGTDEVVYTSLTAKMMTLVCNKFATLDAFGRGIEMEGGKPGWCDALNGLPAIFGSSISETFELKRMMQFMREQLSSFDERSVTLPRELFDFYSNLRTKLAEKLNAFDFWYATNNIKEDYREATHWGFSAGDVDVRVSDILVFLNDGITRIEEGLSFLDKRKDIPSFFSAELTKYQVRDGVIVPAQFKQRELPLFLEGYVRAYKTLESKDVAAMHAQVLKSPLYDKAIKMFKLNAPLEKESYEVGRARVFKPGWLENESIWLHMEYKYLLELIKAGCMKEFYDAMKGAFVCNLDPQMYGRSVLENSSFIASSAYVNKNVWGRGFVARLSGSTIEAMHIASMIFMGKAPFAKTADGVSLSFAPAIAGEMFTTKEEKREIYIAGKKTAVKTPKNAFSFMFLGKTVVTYHNAKRKNTWEAKPAKITVAFDNGKKAEFVGGSIPEPESLLVRNGRAKTIDIHY